MTNVIIIEKRIRNLETELVATKTEVAILRKKVDEQSTLITKLRVKANKFLSKYYAESGRELKVYTFEEVLPEAHCSDDEYIAALTTNPMLLEYIKEPSRDVRDYARELLSSDMYYHLIERSKSRYV